MDKDKLTYIFVIGFAFLLIYKAVSSSAIDHPTGIQVAPNDPQQYNIDSPTPFKHDHFTITPKAEYEITARILGVENYMFDAGSVLSPVDLALGWGIMSDSAVLQNIEIEQSVRFYSWRTDTYTVPLKEISRHSANTHIIPADSYVRSEIDDLREGHIVHLKGYLVSIKGENNFTWNSSLTRDDTGAGACEVFWVKDIEVFDEPI